MGIIPRRRQQFEADSNSQPKSINFFEHGSNMEIFGDEELTLFDSNKAGRRASSTGSMFGF